MRLDSRVLSFVEVPIIRCRPAWCILGLLGGWSFWCCSESRTRLLVSTREVQLTPPPGHFVAEGISTHYLGVAVDIAFREHVHTFLGPRKQSCNPPSAADLVVFAYVRLCGTMSHVGIAAASLVAGSQPTLAPSSLLSITEAEKASAMPMEPSLEALLRQVNLHEDVIWKFRADEQ